jgi:osmotically inducible protein OsmC
MFRISFLQSLQRETAPAPRDVTRRFIQVAKKFVNLDVIPMPIYTATAMSQGGRKGGYTVAGDIKAPAFTKLEMTLPVEMGGVGGIKEAMNPEVLFAAAYASSFASAVQSVANGMDMNLEGLVVKSKVHIARGPHNGFDLAVELMVQADAEKDLLEEIVVEAHHICPYSRAMQGQIEIVTRII